MITHIVPNLKIKHEQINIYFETFLYFHFLCNFYTITQLFKCKYRYDYFYYYCTQHYSHHVI